MLTKQKQSGFALLLFMIVMIGFIIAGFSGFLSSSVTQLSEQRKVKNTKVLQEAKDALLMFAYNYPQFNLEGPGRLPCPDDDNDGVSGALTLSLCQSVGRFPWNNLNMNFYDARDVSNERLWYAVSENFYNLGGGTIINSDSSGTITLIDQTGAIIYDGGISGIAAVIITPGPAINRDEDNNGSYEYTQVRGTLAEQNDPRNFLDTFNGFDNSQFNNGESDTNDDGFILGPVFDPALNIITVNDQMVIVTADEVVAMAEKATLQAYRDAIDEYQQNIWGANVANYRYPWLDDYSTTDLTRYDADINTVVGRIPAVFDTYFSGNEIDAFVSDTKFIMTPQPGVHTPEHQIEYFPVSAVPDASFDINGNLLTSINSSAVSITRYFWDGHPTESDTLPMDGVFELCPQNLGTEDDCNQDDFGAFIGGTNSEVWLQVYELTITFDSGANPFTLPASNLTSGGPSGRYLPADAAENAYIFGTFNNSGGEYTVDWEYDLDFRSSFNDMGNGTLNSMEVGIVYYPEIGDWAISNDWHNSIQMAITQGYRPGGGGDCSVLGCFIVNNMGGVNNNKVSLLVLAGQHNFIDEAGDGFTNDLLDIFELENDDSNITYDRRAGNDTVLVLQEQ